MSAIPPKQFYESFDLSYYKWRPYANGEVRQKYINQFKQLQDSQLSLQQKLFIYTQLDIIKETAISTKDSFRQFGRDVFYVFSPSKDTACSQTEFVQFAIDNLKVLTTEFGRLDKSKKYAQFNQFFEKIKEQKTEIESIKTTTERSECLFPTYSRTADYLNFMLKSREFKSHVFKTACDDRDYKFIAKLIPFGFLKHTKQEELNLIFNTLSQKAPEYYVKFVKFAVQYTYDIKTFELMFNYLPKNEEMLVSLIDHTLDKVFTKDKDTKLIPKTINFILLAWSAPTQALNVCLFISENFAWRNNIVSRSDLFDSWQKMVKEVGPLLTEKGAQPPSEDKIHAKLLDLWKKDFKEEETRVLESDDQKAEEVDFVTEGFTENEQEDVTVMLPDSEIEYVLI